MNLLDQLIQESEKRIARMGKFKDPSEFPWKRDRWGRPIEKPAPGGYCNLCDRPVYGNCDPDKIITCARCALILHEIAQRNPQALVEYRNSLREKGLLEQARSVESFVVPTGQENIRTFKRTLSLRRFRHTLRGGKRLPRRLSTRI